MKTKNKKYELLGILAIIFVVYVALTWILPQSTISSGEFTSLERSPLGFVDLFRMPLSTISNFIYYALVFMFIGGLYAVMAKTGAYSKMLDIFVAKIKGHERLFVGVMVSFIAILSSISGVTLALFLVVPLFTSLMQLLGFDRKSSLLATVGSILVGTIGSTFGYMVTGALNYYFQTNTTDDLWARIIILVIATFLLIMYVIKDFQSGLMVSGSQKEDNKFHKKKQKKDFVPTAKQESINESIAFYQKNEQSKSSYIPLLVLFIALFTFIVVSMINWQQMFQITLFQDVYESLMSLKIGDFAIVQGILGSMSPIGQFNNYDFTIILLVASLIIGWIYGLKMGDILDSFLEGCKKMLPVGIYAVLSCIITVCLISNSGNIVTTMDHFLLSFTDKFNVFTTVLTAIVNSIFFNDFVYVLNGSQGIITTMITDTTMYSLIGVIFQSLYGILMLVLPTSVLLIAGLSFLKVSFKEWIGYIWKFVLELFAVLMIIFFIMNADLAILTKLLCILPFAILLIVILVLTSRRTDSKKA